jgi:hypothetical protein
MNTQLTNRRTASFALVTELLRLSMNAVGRFFGVDAGGAGGSFQLGIGNMRRVTVVIIGLAAVTVETHLGTPWFDFARVVGLRH